MVVAALCVATTRAADVSDVIVRQQWPWSTDVKVEFKLTNVTAPVDVTVTAFNGAMQLDAAKLASAITGERFGLASSGAYSFMIDPVKAFGTDQVALGDFRVRLSLSDSAASTSEVLYKIIDLDNFTDRDVTRADFLNDKMGDYVTDFKAISNKYWTALSDVLIWTGVTNVPEYRTSKIVLRRIPAKGVTFEMGDIPGAYYSGRNSTGYAHVTLTNNYFISVFEVTEGQYKRMNAVNGVISASPSSNGDEYPVTGAKYNTLRGDTPTLDDWPDDRYCVSSGSLIGHFRANMPGYLFDLPTEAQWEYAARAGTTNDLYIGYKVTANSAFINALSPIAWYEGNSTDYNVVGLKKPNAFGLYDMLGNAREHCRDLVPGEGSSSSYEPQPNEGYLVEPYGMATNGVSTWNIQRGGGRAGATYCTVSKRGLLGKRGGAGMGFRLWLLDD
jgi:formylglycine-generating enzyme required for sulfatase activity